MLNRKQQGMTMIGMFSMFALIGFLTVIALKLFPIYYEAMSASSIINKLKTDTTVNMAPTRKIYSAIASRFNISQISVKASDAVKIKTLQGGKRKVILDYEVRKSMMFNVDVVVVFKEEVELPPARP